MADYTDKIQVRRVTDIHSNWSEQGEGELGKFSFQLILDNGADEYVVRPTVEDSKVLLKLVQASDSVYFDTENQVLIPSGVK
jgi:hypothetical protein